MRPRVSSEGPFSENLLSSLSVEGSGPRCPWTPRPLLCLLSVCIGLTRLPPSALFAEVPADQVPRSEVSRVQGVREGKQTHRQPAARALPAARWVSRASAPPGGPYGAGCRQPAHESGRNTHSPRSALPGSFPSVPSGKVSPRDRTCSPHDSSSPVACTGPQSSPQPELLLRCWFM